MKRVFLALFIILGLSNLYGVDLKVKTDVKLAYPVDFGDRQSDYYSVSPVAELKLDIPVYKNLGLSTSVDFLFGFFQEKKLFGKYKVGNYQFYSVFLGAFYCINLGNSFSLIPNIEVGYSYGAMSLKSGSSHFESLLCLQTSLNLEKELNENWALYAIASFGYYYVYCPLAFGIGVSYHFL